MNFLINQQNSSSEIEQPNLILGVFGKEKEEVQTTDEGQFSQYGQDSLDQYDQEESFNVEQGFQVGHQPFAWIHNGDKLFVTNSNTLNIFRKLEQRVK